MDKIAGMKTPKGKRVKAPGQARRDGVKLGVIILCLLMMLAVPACITIYHDVIPDAAYGSIPPQNAGGTAAHAPELSGTLPGLSTTSPDQSGTPPGLSSVSPEQAQPPAASAGASPGQPGGRTDGTAGGSTGGTAGGSIGGIADDGPGGIADDGPGGIADDATDETADVDAGASAGEAEGGEHDAASGTADAMPAKVAYITLDDGPTRSITPGILDVLKEQGIPATFFVLPHENVDDLYIRIIEEGHEIGNHTYSHVYSRLYQSGGLEVFKDDVLQAHEFMLTNFGYETTSFRFPGGSMGRSASIIAPRQALLDELGYRYFNWHIDSGDARSDIPDRSAAALKRNVLENTRDRDHVIILMHDSAGKGSTLAALPAIIEGLREQGYTFDVLRNYPQE